MENKEKLEHSAQNYNGMMKIKLGSIILEKI